MFQVKPALERALYNETNGGPAHEHFSQTGFCTIILFEIIYYYQSWSGLSVAYEYLVYVKCCHLMLVTVVNVKTENLASVAREFENFNNWILQLQLFLREHEEKYYLKCGIRVRI